MRFRPAGSAGVTVRPENTRNATASERGCSTWQIIRIYKAMVNIRVRMSFLLIQRASNARVQRGRERQSGNDEKCAARLPLERKLPAQEASALAGTALLSLVSHRDRCA